MTSCQVDRPYTIHAAWSNRGLLRAIARLDDAPHLVNRRMHALSLAPIIDTDP
jgi:hypothetical protein